jgi:hypothetical protein
MVSTEQSNLGGEQPEWRKTLDTRPDCNNHTEVKWRHICGSYWWFLDGIIPEGECPDCIEDEEETLEYRLADMERALNNSRGRYISLEKKLMALMGSIDETIEELDDTELEPSWHITDKFRWIRKKIRECIEEVPVVIGGVEYQ